jgi:hypothetical protein
MGTMARKGAAILVAGVALTPALAWAAPGEPGAFGGAAPARRPAIGGGHDRSGAWLNAQYRDLQVRKRLDRSTGAVAIELKAGNDLVMIVASRDAVTVSRQGRSIGIRSAEALASVQALLGNSPAIFATRGMLSELEPRSDYKAPETSLLAAAAFVASLVGDTGAPQRIADRFVEKHRGLYRQVMTNGTCWYGYTIEATAAWNDLQGLHAGRGGRRVPARGVRTDRVQLALAAAIRVRVVRVPELPLAARADEAVR